MKHENNPSVLLEKIAARLAESSHSEADKKELKNVWSGVGFSLCGQFLVAPMGEVIEIIPVPKYTFVPGAKDWVLGVANVRGRLMPIIDMENYFGSRLTGNRSDYRILIAEINRTQVGLVVSKVFGLKHFDHASFVEPNKSNAESYKDFVDAECEEGDQVWHRLLPSLLFNSNEFNNASAIATEGINDGKAA